MIPTLMHHGPTCTNPKPPTRDSHSAGVVVWKCPDMRREGINDPKRLTDADLTTPEREDITPGVSKSLGSGVRRYTIRVVNNPPPTS